MVSLISSGLLRVVQSLLEHVSKNVLIHHGGSNCSLSPTLGRWGHLPHFISILRLIGCIRSCLT